MNKCLIAIHFSVTLDASLAAGGRAQKEERQDEDGKEDLEGEVVARARIGEAAGVPPALDAIEGAKVSHATRPTGVEARLARRVRLGAERRKTHRRTCNSDTKSLVCGHSVCVYSS